jgi:ABC-type glycerol-3-phosphate transport system substrate-binding protein
MSKFQIITLAIFIIAIIAGAASFALYKGSGSQQVELPTITVWGTFPSSVFDQYVSEINSDLSSSLKVNYVEQKPSEFSKNFVNALALDQGPDAILVPVEMLLPEINKLAFIPYSVLPKNTFYNSYIDQARIYLGENGSLGIPFTIDPLVMYWNRDTFNSAGIATYPKFWDEFVGTSLKPGLAQKLTERDSNGNIRKTAIAMGDFLNITNAREVLGSLLLQSDNPVTTVGDDGFIVSTIDPFYRVDPRPALQFFSQFANPSNQNYSWNRGMPNDKTAFLSGILATYFGYTSDIYDIRSKNHNLNFDVSGLPQLRSGGKKALYSKMYGFSLVKSSPKLDASFQVISTLTSAENLQKLSQKMYAPSVRRDIIAKGSSDPYITIFNQSALVAKSWLDISASQSRQLFGNLIQTIISGQKSIDQAVKDTGDQYDVLLRQVQ